MNLNSGRWIKVDQLDVTCFIISLFTAQHVSNASTSILKSLRLVDLFRGLYCSGSMCVGVMVWFGWGGVVSLCGPKHCFLIIFVHFYLVCVCVCVYVCFLFILQLRMYDIVASASCFFVCTSLKMIETCRSLAIFLYTFVSNCCAILCFLNCALWYTYVLRTNKMHTFYINDLIKLQCLRSVSNIQVFILRKTCTCSFMVFLSCWNYNKYSLLL